MKYFADSQAALSCQNQIYESETSRNLLKADDRGEEVVERATIRMSKTEETEGA